MKRSRTGLRFVSSTLRLIGRTRISLEAAGSSKSKVCFPLELNSSEMEIKKESSGGPSRYLGSLSWDRAYLQQNIVFHHLGGKKKIISHKMILMFDLSL